MIDRELAIKGHEGFGAAPYPRRIVGTFGGSDQVGLSAEVAQGRSGIGEVRGELKGVRLLIETLRGDFRAHVFGRQD